MDYKQFHAKNLPPESILNVSPQPAALAGEPIACPRCGAIDAPEVVPGSGPHYASARFRHCHRFLQWLSRYSPEERSARREQAKLQVMASRPITEHQLWRLRALGWRGPQPADRAEASLLIDTLLRKKGGGA